ncbi:MAG: hypothetical protein ACJAY2_002093 [Pseudomonadales bacterium]|jgi:hypothetical protein
MVFVLFGSISACGSKGASTQAELNTIDEVMQQAIKVGADELAPVELRLAREKQRQAYAAMKAKKYAKAQRFSREAKVDAQLAVALATTVKSRHALKGVRGDILVESEAGTQKSSFQEDSLRALVGG